MRFLSKAKRRRNAVVPAVYLALLVVCGFVVGCGKKDAGTAATAPANSLKGHAPNVSTGEAKLTPEQEASKQRAIQQGPSVEAANEAAAKAANDARIAGK